jgi:tRNA modification GTPase
MNNFDKSSDTISDFGSPENTIVAIASPRASGAIGIIRVSGPNTVQITASIFVSSNKNTLFPPKPRMASLGYISNPADNHRVDQVELVFYPSPNSYTGEDVIEIFCHGGLLVTREILDLFISSGAVPAQPGEFTSRAFLNGKMDLTQAESVLDVINARNRNFLDAAVRQLEGSFGSAVRKTRRTLIELLAKIEVAIEYSDEHSSQISRQEIDDLINYVIRDLKRIIDSADSVRLSNECLKIAIIGKPNVGKSSLMNCILGTDRVIVSDIPGTTRDLVGDYISLGGFDFLLMDTAGITISENVIEAEGIRKTRSFLQSADIILALFDSSCPWSNDDDEVINAIKNITTVIPVMTKYDLPRFLVMPCLTNSFSGISPVATSSRTGVGIPDLLDRLKKLTDSRSAYSPDSIIINARHRQLLEAAMQSLSSVLNSVFSVPDDILAIDIKETSDFLGKITGESTTDDVLESIFSNFCVGK